MKHPTVISELKGLLETFRLEPFIVLLFPMFWVSNWFYTYQFNTVNAARFDVRTRALNSTVYWAAQMFGALLFGYALDFDRLSRRTRARAAWGALFFLTMVRTVQKLFGYAVLIDNRLSGAAAMHGRKIIHGNLHQHCRVSIGLTRAQLGESS